MNVAGPGVARLRAALARTLPSMPVVADPEGLRVYECDGLSAYRQPPGLVALPGSVDEVRTVLSLAMAHDVPVVTRGAGTGLSGGALPRADGLLLALSRLDRILAIDPANATATVQPGVRNLAISEAAARHGLFYAPDPSSQVACTIGGNVAENSGGVHCLKYGLTVHNLLAVALLTPDGALHRIGGQALEEGPDDGLLALVTGSEGLLGVVVEVTVRLRPRPEARAVVLAGFDAVSDAAAAVTAIIGAGLVPAGLEMMDRLAIEAAEQYVHAGYPLDVEAVLLTELDGSEGEVADWLRRLQPLLDDAGARTQQVAREPAHCERLWSGRKAAFPAIGRIAPDYYCMDGTIARHRLGEVLEGIAALSAEYGLPVANVFHAGDGNLHPLIAYDGSEPGALGRVEELGARILELCLAAGGTITGEHGVGVEKLDQMCAQFPPAELGQFHAIREAFDPQRRMNPGKAIPTLARCAELGGMHVHGGELPFAELPRF